ncbi:hypothetical protein [Desulfosediminicola flagellatus]|uniref:hypothetical protein n=1 Tax=Desulfosediminicola flagellatus TaxID=2569541 RepID=UPI001294849B|nr:hypothetical protein [Desulfosediminicola flagellatus]
MPLLMTWAWLWAGEALSSNTLSGGLLVLGTRSVQVGPDKEEHHWKKIDVKIPVIRIE